jgi:hypothetical protein
VHPRAREGRSGSGASDPAPNSPSHHGATRENGTHNRSVPDPHVPNRLRDVRQVIRRRRCAHPPEIVSAREPARAAGGHRPGPPHHLETFLADAAAADPDGDGIAQWIEDDFRAYLRCGILAHRFARIRCDACAAERLVAFSCKGPGACPCCNARRMVEVAAHLADHVPPPLPVRVPSAAPPVTHPLL